MALPLNDNCTRANENPLSGWTTISGLNDLQLSSNAVRATTAPSAASWTADTPTADCMMEVTIGAVPTVGTAMFLRLTTSTLSGYGLLVLPDGWGHYRYDNAVTTQLSWTARTTQTGDVFRFLIFGSTLRCKINGVLQSGSATDTTYASAASACLYFGDTTGTVTSIMIDNFTIILDQHSFRFVNDDGSESASTFNANLNTNVNLSANDVKRIRMLVDALGDPAGKKFQLEFRRKPSGGSFGDWNKVN